jgi:leader peptidase (prepilin peptidase) / N-methyltransferase
VEGQIVAVTAALLVSPVLASWTQRLTDDERSRWWYPQRVCPARWLTVALVATGLALVACRATPVAAWWLLATFGSVLVIVDAQTYRLPARLVGPLAIAELFTLIASAVILDEPHRLLRAVLSATIVTTVWFGVVLISPSAMGMGDVYLCGITAAALGWSGWTQVILGQLAVWFLAPIVLIAVALAHPHDRGWKMHVPLGPALVGGAMLVCLL